MKRTILVLALGILVGVAVGWMLRDVHRKPYQFHVTGGQDIIVSVFDPNTGKVYYRLAAGSKVWIFDPITEGH